MTSHVVTDFDTRFILSFISRVVGSILAGHNGGLQTRFTFGFFRIRLLALSYVSYLLNSREYLHYHCSLTGSFLHPLAIPPQ